MHPPTPAPALPLRSLLLPIAALAFATLVCSTLLAARMVFIGHARQLYLAWNLFLAWLPLIFALAACSIRDRQPARPWRFRATTAAWFVFFPNAPYILTDLIHLGSRSQRHYWPDLVIILLFALTGLVLGFLSLYLMQRLVARQFGAIRSWAFAAAMAGLGGFGIYAGRFLRWNSWDVLLNPIELVADAGRWLAAVPQEPRGFLLPLLFGALFFTAHLLLYALTHLHGPMPGHRPEHAAAGRLRASRSCW